MAAQMRHLTALASLPHVTIQVVPATAHAGLAGGFTVTDHGAYAESVMRGQVFETDETVTALSLRFDTLRSSACSAPDRHQATEAGGGPMEWRKSTYSVENGNCVEVASAGPVMIRDTQDRDGVTLTLPASAWRAFTAQVRAGSAG